MKRDGLRIARVFGINISLDFSWFIIFFLVTWSLASGYFPFKYPFFTRGMYWMMGVFSSLLLFITVLMHELSHSVVANQNGLNIRGIKLFVFGGVAQLSKEPQSARVEFDVAIAGPICSFILHFLFKGIALFLSPFLPGGPQNPIIAVLMYLSFINVFLGIINLIPAYPLDGGRILRAFIWAITNNLKKATAIASNAGKLFALFLIFNGFLMTIRGTFTGLWLVFIGMFLFSAAKAGYEQTVLRDALTKTLVKDVMSPHVDIIHGDIKIEKAIEDYFFRYHHSSFPVEKDGHIKGMLNLSKVKGVPRSKWSEVTALECVEPINNSEVISPNEKVIKNLNRLMEHNTAHLLVVKNEKIVGIVTRIDIMKLLRMKMNLGV